MKLDSTDVFLEEVIKARSLIKSVINTDYVKEHPIIKREMLQWQRRLDELLPRK